MRKRPRTRARGPLTPSPSRGPACANAPERASESGLGKKIHGGAYVERRFPEDRGLARSRQGRRTRVGRAPRGPQTSTPGLGEKQNTRVRRRDPSVHASPNASPSSPSLPARAPPGPDLRHGTRNKPGEGVPSGVPGKHAGTRPGRVDPGRPPARGPKGADGGAFDSGLRIDRDSTENSTEARAYDERTGRIPGSHLAGGGGARQRRPPARPPRRRASRRAPPERDAEGGFGEPSKGRGGPAEARLPDTRWTAPGREVFPFSVTAAAAPRAEGRRRVLVDPSARPTSSAAAAAPSLVPQVQSPANGQSNPQPGAAGTNATAPPASWKSPAAAPATSPPSPLPKEETI